VRAHDQTLSSLVLRCLLISTLAMSGVTMLAVIGPEAFTTQIVLAATSNGVEREARAVQPAVANYVWNLNDDGLPLISLPDRLSGSLDQSLTYSMDQFEFPLFQSLYYKQRARKYILMVTAKDELTLQASNAGGLMNRHAEFIQLVPIGAGGKFAASGKMSLRLENKGGTQVLTTSDATVFSFAVLADGELHCRQINDRHGAVLFLKYNNDASLESISDDRGRTITFNYTNQYVSSVAQTWGGNAKRLRKSWAVADEVRYAHAVTAPVISNFARPAVSVSVSTLAKHVPSNAIRATYTQAMAASDSVLAEMFGGPGAIAAANGYEPLGLDHQYPLYRGDLVADDGRILRGHLSFAMHLYGSADGTGETALYIPAGFTAHSREPSPIDAVMTFYYPRLGKLRDVTLAVFHIRDFQFSYEGERVRIGSIGGPGGSAASYRHSHLEFYHGNTGLPPLRTRVQLRIDPAAVFTSTTGAVKTQ
jgi:hypothetical protein